MAFEAELRGYLERVAEGERAGREPPQRSIDEGALRAYFLNRLRTLEASGEYFRVAELHRIWSPWLRRFARYIATLPASAAPASAADAQVFAEHALELAMGMDRPTRTGRVEQLELERIVRDFQAPWSSEIEDMEEAERYAAETYLVRDEPAVGVRLTPLGTAFLRLRGKTAIRWLMTSELLQNTDRGDPWRTPRQLLEMALDERGIVAAEEDGYLETPFDAGLVGRLTELGVLRRIAEGGRAIVYRAAEAWRDAIRTMLGTTPWHQAIDIVVENRCVEPPWRSDGSTYLLGECKNWSKKCGAAELRALYEKLTTKYRRAHTGFFIAPGGFTDDFHVARGKHGTESALVILVDLPDLERWIAVDDRLGVLGELHKRAVFDQKR